MSGLPNTNAWVRVSITTLSQRNTTPVYLRTGETLSVNTNSSVSNIIVSPILIETTRLSEGAISTSRRLVNGKAVYDIKPLNCNAKFNYQIFEYY